MYVGNNENFAMNNKFLRLSLLAALLSGVASARSNDDAVQLQPFVVSSARYSEAEKQIEASLQELRDSAHAPAATKVELPSLQRTVNPSLRVRLPDMAATPAEGLTLRAAVKA